MIVPPALSQDPAEQVRRLERRLAREREARLAAEQIAERGTRDLFIQQQRLTLVESIARAANLLDDPTDAFSFALEQICAFTGWTTGHVWLVDEDPGETGELVSSGIWRPNESLAQTTFRQTTEMMTLVAGKGLPGRILESRRAIWIEDLGLETNFPRLDVARECGLRAAFAFPALIGAEVGAVLEFFLQVPTKPDEILLRTLEQIGAQLGRVVERDRHARRQTAHNAALEAGREAAEQASRAKSAFLAVTSHEVRTPLNAVLGLAEALKREPLTEKQHELNDGVLASGQMLLRLLNAVLDMSKIEADQATAQMSDFDMPAKVQAIVRIWTPRANELGIELSLDTSGLEPGPIRSDEGRIEQTLVNLVANAVKFTPRGGNVAIHASSGEGMVRLEVMDGGPGVPDADRDRVFQPFEQTEAGRQAGGAGLGLSICTGNMRLLGGRIGTDRTEMGRSRFWFECPVAAVMESDVAATTEVHAVRHGLRVLAAEDNAANRRVLQALLTPADVELTFAENGQEALDALGAGVFDLVLMDANMPVMDGPEAVRRIRAGDLARGAPVYMLTANAFADDVSRYMAAGADGVLTKPIQLPALFAILAACGENPSAAEVA